MMEGLKEDRLEGAAAIADFIGIDRRRVFDLAERKLLPVGKEGGRLVASKKVLSDHYAKLTRAGSASA